MPAGHYTRKVKKVIRPIGPSIAYVPLTQGMYARINSSRADSLGKWNWHLLKGRNTYYAVRLEHILDKTVAILMHQAILQYPGSDIDHRDRDGLNNCDWNLRPTTQSCNGANQPRRKAGLKGVVRRRKMWEARICVDRKRFYLGVFPSQELAARAYDNAAVKAFGEFAYINFPLHL